MEFSSDFDPDEIYQRFITEAPFVPVDSFARVETEQIPWLNLELLQQGQQFYRDNTFAINLSHIGTLLFGFPIKSVSTVLFRNANFDSVKAARVRFIETVAHMSSWYESELVDYAGDGSKDLQVVKKLHALVLKKCVSKSEGLFEPNSVGIERAEEKEAFLVALKADLACVDTVGAPTQLFTYNPPVLMSQFDFVITQYGFMAFVVLAPQTLGIRNRDGLKGFIHLWAVLGRLLGIDDRFNLALYPNRSLYMRIYRDLAIACLQSADLASAHAQFMFGEAVGQLLPLCTPRAALVFALSSKETLPEFKGEQLGKNMSWSDWIKLYLLQWLVFLIYHFDCVRQLSNALFRGHLRRQKLKLKNERRGTAQGQQDSDFL